MTMRRSSSRTPMWAAMMRILTGGTGPIRREYMLSMIGYAVGLGNVWRFPYLAYKNGGGAFLIPYVIMLAVAGIPMFFLESSFGVGVAMVLSPLPWSDCFYWSNSNCSLTPREVCNITPAANWSVPVIAANMTLWENETCPKENIFNIPVQSPSEQYWDLVALQRHQVFRKSGVFHRYISLCGVADPADPGSYTRGRKRRNRVLHWLPVQPHKTGRGRGVERCSHTDLLFSVNSVGWCHSPVFYNKFHNNVFKDALTVCLTNCGTSVFAGFAIFSILGHMAHVYGKPVSEVAQAGFGLAFIAYPDALSKLPISPLWSILFFFMLLTLSDLTRSFAGIGHLHLPTDAFPETFKSKRSIISVATCAILFLLGLPCAGIYLGDSDGSVVLVLALFYLIAAALLELVGVFYIYGK
ncbi:hypothetical protein J4Q44_G00080980 [Coregonus suidteri]|uniref:Transporter n=1 Tax=Coregonus suidteri TaxID=861788 RepID=A0AAN8M5F2_9TELE